MKKTAFFMVILVVIAIRPSSATIRYVPSDDYPTIQMGIDACNHGDTVLVMPGTYVECINFDGHNIVVASLFLTTGDTSFVSTTVIDGDSSCSVVTFENGESNMAVITGFTIRNGYGNLDGGGIYCGNYSNPYINTNIIIGNAVASGGGGIYCWNHSNPVIVNNTISGNSGSFGGGICCDGASSPTIRNNIIYDNSVNEPGYGGGIRCEQDSTNPTISNNTISSNWAQHKGGGVDCDETSAPTIINNIIIGNSTEGNGGGIHCSESNPAITNNTITGNVAVVSGGGNYCVLVSNPVITNTIFWADGAPYESEIDFDDSSSPYFTYCDIQGGWGGEGNIDSDPLFRDPENGDFHLMADSCGDVYNSPCIDAGDPAIFDSMLGCDWGLGELRSDIGAYGGEGIPTDVDEEQTPEIPIQFLLSQNYPNPFNASTTILYTLPNASHVTIDIYDILGRKIETLMQGKQPAGYHQVVWNTENKSSGIYLYRIKAGDYCAMKKMLLLK